MSVGHRRIHNRINSDAMATKPNILWLNTDHYAYAHHFSLHRELLHTPTFDRLCAEGLCCENAYTVCPLCTPARASLVTGQYPHRHGILNNEGWGGSRSDFKPDAPLYSHTLREAGYDPVFLGKWHAVGKGSGTAQDHGFNGWTLPGYGFPYATPAYREYLQEQQLPQPEVDVEWHLNDPSKTGRVRLMEEPNVVYRMGSCGVLLSPRETHEAYFLAHLANRYLEEHVHNGQPFCLRVDTWGPHQPYYVAAPFASTVNPQDIASYPNFSHTLLDRPAHHRDFQELITRKATVRAWKEWQPIVARCYEHIALVEHALSTILETLDRLGLRENTLVIYSADHGDILASHGGLFDKGWLMVEETMRIPFAVRWPQRVTPGGKSEALITNLDIVATLLDVAGATPGDRDGQSLLPLIQESDGSAPAWREDLMLESHGHYERWVFQRMLRWRNWKYVAHLDDKDELYDLETDPYELCNRIDDPVAQDVKCEMQKRLLLWMNQSRDDAPDAQRLRKQLQPA